MRLLFTTDLHGSTLLWQKALRASKSFRVDVLVVAGDLAGKVAIPVINKSNGSYYVDNNGSKETIATKQDLDKFIQQAANYGQYAIILSEQEFEQCGSNNKIAESYFRKSIFSRIREWLEPVYSQTMNLSYKILVSPGNDDYQETDEVLGEFKNDWIFIGTNNLVRIDEQIFVNLSYVPYTPWDTPRELPEEEILSTIDRLMQNVGDSHKCIFNFHCPPKFTQLDVAPEINSNQKLITEGGKVKMTHIGSKAIYDAISKYQPFLSLHGHAHESPGQIRIGKTVAINPGSEYAQGILRAHFIETRGFEVVSHSRIER